MGKAKRAKKAARKEPDQKPDSASENVDLGRRRALQWMAGTAVVVGVGGIVGYNTMQGADYSFMHVPPGRKANLGSDEILETCVRIGIATPIDQRSYDFEGTRQAAMPHIQRALDQSGFEGNVNLEASRLEFVVPEEPEPAHALRAYCLEAQRFMREHVPGLEQLNLDWIVAEQGQDFSQDANMKALIGVRRYTLRKIDITDRATGGRQLGADLFLVYPAADGSSAQNNWGATPEADDYYWINVNTGKFSLNVPFSEALPIVTQRATIAFKEREGLNRVTAQVYDETICESVAQVLSVQLAKELRIPGGVEFIEQGYKGITRNDSKYQLVPKAVTWIKANSIAAALDAYRESPGDFIKRVGNR